VFEPDELDAVLRALSLARELGDPHLASQCDSARRKLTLDLPDVAPSEDDGVIVPRRDGNAETLRELGTAMLRSKRVSFTYHAIGSDTTTERTVEPYGLFLQSGHWYLVGRDVAKDAVRNFRVARIAGARANTSKPQSVDYTIPRGFRLSAHARSRKAWELGDGDAENAIVEFRGANGAVKAAMKLGSPVIGAPRQQRAFQVRRIDVFARWLLSFAGDAVPIAPAQLVDAYREIVRQTLAVYDGAGT
jgi:proteasome accessory factor B